MPLWICGSDLEHGYTQPPDLQMTTGHEDECLLAVAYFACGKVAENLQWACIRSISHGLEVEKFKMTYSFSYCCITCHYIGLILSLVPLLSIFRYLILFKVQ